jgi:hypothetical protein
MRRYKYGDRGSPCRKPLLQVIHLPGIPLRSTADIEVEKMMSIQSHQITGKPLASITRLRLPQSIESKAFVKSSFRTTDGTFLFWQHWTISVA